MLEIFAHSSVNNEYKAFFYFNDTHMFQILMTGTTVPHLDGNMPYGQHREEWDICLPVGSGSRCGLPVSRHSAGCLPSLGLQAWEWSP